MHCLFSQIINLFLPARCPICNEIEQRQLHLCEECEKDISRITERCIGCGRPKLSCNCSRNGFSLCLAAPFEYENKLREAIHRFKFDGETELAKFFGAEMTKCVKDEFSDTHFDIITCVPQTKKKRRKRGYNQSALLARECAKHLGVDYNELLMIKRRETPDQHGLKGKARLSNLKDAFAVDNSTDIKGKTILLCDDIKTTGATLHECRKTLLKAGAEAVCCTTIAVTPEKIRTE